MVIRFAGEGGHAPMMQVGLVFMGSSGTFEGGFYHCCLKGCTILKGKLLGNISLKQGCIGNWNA